jgi:nitrile hydratase
MSHDHDHDDHADDHDHHHLPPSDHNATVTEFEVLERAIRALLIRKGVFSAEDVSAQIELMDGRTPELGAGIIAKAWTEPAFKSALLKDARATLLGQGIDIGTIADYKVVENTPRVHNVIVCTLCSCYPKLLLGIPPVWYKSAPYRSRVVIDPRGVLDEFGLHIPEDVEVRVHDSTAELRYIVLPMRPEGTEGWPAKKLAGLVSRDAMIGTAVPKGATKPTAKAKGKPSARKAASRNGRKAA